MSKDNFGDRMKVYEAQETEWFTWGHYRVAT